MNIPSANRPTLTERAIANRRSLRFLVPTALVICGVALLWSGVDLGDIRNWLHSLGPWAPLAFVLISVAMMSVLVPKTAVSLTAGALFGTMLGSLLMLVIAVAAASLNYSIGRWWLHDSIRQMLQRKQLQSDTDQISWMHAVADIAADAGFSLHFLIRMSPVPTMVISYCMGALGGRWRPFLLAAAVAIIPQMLWVHGGATASLIHNPDASTLSWISATISIMMAILISVVVPRKAMNRLREMKASPKDRPSVLQVPTDPDQDESDNVPA